MSVLTSINIYGCVLVPILRASHLTGWSDNATRAKDIAIVVNFCLSSNSLLS